MAASIAFHSVGTPAKIAPSGGQFFRQTSHLRCLSPVSARLRSVQIQPSLGSQCRWTTSSASSGVRAQVAAAEQASVDVPQRVEAPVVIITGASRGIGKAIALALGKAGCMVNL